MTYILFDIGGTKTRIGSSADLKTLVHRTTIFQDEQVYELNLNAFDQPNVELYKKKTRAILGL